MDMDPEPEPDKRQKPDLSLCIICQEKTQEKIKYTKLVVHW